MVSEPAEEKRLSKNPWDGYWGNKDPETCSLKVVIALQLDSVSTVVGMMVQRYKGIKVV